MHDLRLTLGIVGLAAACGPVAPQQTTSDSDSTGDSTDNSSGGPGTDTDPTGEPPEPTSTTTTPPGCVESSDCYDLYCGYCDAGVCRESVGCCGVAGARPDAQRWRCGPYYECYGDSDCPDGDICEFGECVPLPIPDVLPPCPALDMTLGQWQLGATPGAFVLADLDADGDLDLAAAQPGVAQIEVALNDGAGGFTLAGAFGVGEPTAALALAAGDLDDDKDNDLAVVRRDMPGGLILLFGQDAVFTPQPALATAPEPAAVFIADMEGTSFNDIVTITADGVRLRKINNADEIVLTTDPIDPRAHLVDLGGPEERLDLVGSNLGGTGVGVWVGVDGQLELQLSIDTGVAQNATLAGDIDLITQKRSLILTRTVDDRGEIAVLAGVEPPTAFADPVLFFTSLPIVGATLFDLDAPQGDDILATTGEARVLQVLGDAEGGFSCERVVAIPAPTTRDLLVAGDLNGDTHVDLVVGDPNSATVTVLLAP